MVVIFYFTAFKLQFLNGALSDCVHFSSIIRTSGTFYPLAVYCTVLSLSQWTLTPGRNQSPVILFTPTYLPHKSKFTLHHAALQELR